MKAQQMRIAIIPTPELRCETGSTIHAVLLADLLAAVGHEVHVYCLNHPDLPHSKVTFHDLPLPLVHPVLVDRPISDAQLMSCMQMLADAVVAAYADAPFNVVHAHYATVTGLAGLMVQTVCGTPLILSCFGRDLNIGASQDARYARMVALTVSQAQAVIASDASIARQLVNLYAVPADRVFAIPMGIDNRLFTQQAFHPDLRAALLRDADYLIVNVSSCFALEKGIDVLLQATRCLLDKNLRLSVVIIGEDDLDDLQHDYRLRHLTTLLGLEQSVTFVGRLAHRDIPAYMAAADVVVDPRTVGNFSSTTLESLFAGAVVVSSDVTGNRLWIEDGHNGLLHRAGDVAHLGTQLARALTDTKLRDTISSGITQWMTERSAHFTADHMRDRTLDVYRRVAVM